MLEASERLRASHQREELTLGDKQLRKPAALKSGHVVKTHCVLFSFFVNSFFSIHSPSLVWSSATEQELFFSL